MLMPMGSSAISGFGLRLAHQQQLHEAPDSPNSAAPTPSVPFHRQRLIAASPTKSRINSSQLLANDTKREFCSPLLVKEEIKCRDDTATDSSTPLSSNFDAIRDHQSGRKVSSSASSRSSSTPTKRRWEKPEVCLICGQPAQCLNFGAHCCHACRMFFRRSVLNLKEFFCKFDGNCDTTKGKNCRSCRFDACVLAELDISLIQFPPDFDVIGLKQRLESKRRELRQRRERQAATIFANGIEKSFSNIIELVEFNKCLDHLLLAERQATKLRSSPNNLILEYLCGKGLADFLNSQMNVLNFVDLFTMNGAPLKKEQHGENQAIPSIGNYLNLDMLLNVELMRTLPVCEELSLEDKICLFGHNIHKLVTLGNGFYSFLLNAETITHPNNTNPANMCRRALERTLAAEDLRRYANLRKRAFDDVLNEFKTIKLSEEEFVLLRAVLFCNTVPDECSAEAKLLLKADAERYARCLLRHLQTKLGEMEGAQKYAECLLFAAKIFDFNRRQGKMYRLVDQQVFGLDHGLPNPGHPPFVFECLLQSRAATTAAATEYNKQKQPSSHPHSSPHSHCSSL